MARMNLEQSTKYRRFVIHCKRHLGIDKATVRGLLEQLWDVAHSFGPDFKTAQDVEAAAQWDGDEGKLAQALIENRWIDKNGDGLTIHDYWDHAPHFAKERQRKKNQRQAAPKVGDTAPKVGDTAPKVGDASDSRLEKPSQAKPREETQTSDRAPVVAVATMSGADTEAPNRHLVGFTLQTDHEWLRGVAEFHEAWSKVPESSPCSAKQTRAAAAEANITTDRWPALIALAKRWQTSHNPDKTKRKSAAGFLRDEYWTVDVPVDPQIAANERLRLKYDGPRNDAQ